MPWVSVGLSVAGSLMGGGGSKAAERAAKRQEKRIENELVKNKLNYAPYQNVGIASNKQLSNYLGQDYVAPLNAKEISTKVGDAYDNGYRLDGRTREEIIKGAIDNYNLGRYGDDATARKAFGIESPDSATDENTGMLLRPFSQDDLDNDVVYNSGLQFGLDEGIKGVNRQATARGGLDSGATLKALTRYANDYGTTKASGAFDRNMANKNSIYNFLSGSADRGLNATNSMSSNNSNLLGMQGQAAQQAASAKQDNSNNWTNAIQGAIGNYIYGSERAKDRGVVGQQVPTGGYSQPTTPWYLT